MGTPKISHWQVKSNANEVALAAKDIILTAADRAIHARGMFKIVLAGGTTPEQIYTLLAKEACHWEKWRIYLGDERCLPVEDSERNSHMIHRTLLDNVDFPRKNIHFIPAELGAIEAAVEYEQVIHPALPFDLVMLGMGEDGHTASLFPDHQHTSNELVHAVFNAPKPPSDRVTISAASLSQTRNLLRIITGASKAESVALWGKGGNLPIAKITAIRDDIVLLDKAAAANLT